MFSLQLPTISPLLGLTYVPSFNCRLNENTLSPFKLYSTIGKGTGERPNLECLAIIPKSRLAPTISASDFDIEDHKKAEEELREELMPKHVAMIMDGNGRWAKSRGLPTVHGHVAGSSNLVLNLIPAFSKLGIKIVTVYAFSTENWKRSKMEVNLLMGVFEDFIHSYVQTLMERYDVRFSVIGNRTALPKSLQSAILSTEESSKNNKGIHLVGALSYSGRYDIVEATKKIATQIEEKILRPTDIDETLFGQQLMTNYIEFPDPDLLIRTSGELRLSNFLLWQLAYTELYFSGKAFPDFGEKDLIEAVASFQKRHRRYGERKS